MSKITMRIKKEIPMKIYREKLKIDNNLDMLLNLRSNRESKNNNLYNDSINNAEKPKSNGRINNKRFLTEKKILKLNYKELLRFNSSSDITNINTQNNSLNNLTQNELQNNIRLIISNRYSKEINNTESNIRKKDLNKLFSHNLIKFEDRRKIKKLNSSKVLRLYQLYLQRKNQKFQIDELLPTDRTFSNKKIESEKNNLFSNYNNINHPLNKSFYNYSNISTYRSKQKSNKNKRKYNLNILMKLNPYHLVSTKVKYSNYIDMKDISNKLTELDDGGIKIRRTETPLFFKNSNIKKNKIGKMINSSFVQFNQKISHECDFIWRILSMIKKVSGYSPFYTSCLFKGYYELWKNYSVLIEQLLVKYPLFKWYLDKNRYMKEEVFNEFISCLKLETKNDKTIATKILLLFGENGLIDIKKFLLIMELSSISTDIVEKVNFIEDLLYVEELKGQEHYINVMEMFMLLINIFNSPNCKKDIKYFKEILKNEFNKGKKFNNDLFINKRQMSELLLNNKFMQKKLNEFSNFYKNADKNYEEQINFHYNSNARALNNIFSDEMFN
jgi:hypothetical protein